MSKGGSTCNRLKFIRKRLAEQNGIDYKVERCPNSDNCKEGTCPFCEKEADDLMAVLLEKEKRGEKVIWDVSLDEYDPNTLYGDRTELDGNEVVIHGDAKFGEVTIPPIDINPSTLEKIERRVATMGVLRDDVMEMPDLKDRRTEGMVDAPPIVNHPYLDLQGYTPNPNKEFEFPFKTVDAPWFDIDNKNENWDDFYNENQDSSISLEKPLVADVSWLKNDSLKPVFSKPFRNFLMGDIAIPEYTDMGLVSDVEFAPIEKFMAVDNSDLMMVKTDPTDLDDDNVDETLLALQHIHQSTSAKFTDTLNAYLREGKDVEKAIEYLTTYGGYEKRNVQNDKPEEKSENAEPRTIPDDLVESNDNPITLEAIKAVRKATSVEMMYCKRMLQKYDGDVDKAIEEINNHPPKRPLMGRVMMDDEKEGKR